MPTPSELEMSRRNLLIGTASSVAIGTVAQAARAQNTATGGTARGGHSANNHKGLVHGERRRA